MLTVSTQIALEDDLALFQTMLDSISFADEIRIYSFGRDDKELLTVAKKHRATVVSLDEPLPKIVEMIRAREIHEAVGDWVLIMDPDELVTESLQDEIKEVVTHTEANISAYTIRRVNFSLGMKMRYGGFGDDHVHRLFRKIDFVDWPHDIHSTPVVRGDVGQLNGYMEHHKDASLSQMVAKTNRYSDQEAQQFFAGGLPPVTRRTLIRKPVMEFIRRYFLKKGFLDGRIGLIQSLYQGYSVFVTYAKLFERQNHKSRNGKEAI